MNENLTIRTAKMSDLCLIKLFVDYWLSGRGLKDNAPGACNDCFISPSQHKRYINKCITVLAYKDHTLVAWAVMMPNGTLIHLLVNGYYRNQGIGKAVVDYLSPKVIRSKSNQSTGNPAPFYESLGYSLKERDCSRPKNGLQKSKSKRPKIIDVYVK